MSEWNMIAKSNKEYNMNSSSDSGRDKAKVMKRSLGNDKAKNKDVERANTVINDTVKHGVRTSQQWVHLSDSFLQALFTDREM